MGQRRDLLQAAFQRPVCTASSVRDSLSAAVMRVPCLDNFWKTRTNIVCVLPAAGCPQGAGQLQHFVNVHADFFCLQASAEAGDEAAGASSFQGLAPFAPARDRYPLGGSSPPAGLRSPSSAVYSQQTTEK